ncbi:MAG: hypothetical protein GF390_04270 [Candidatus Pacebacteria bacterium]|nr:hypothetical protein [Candidatus Paceibacterota bacterium]
MNEKRASEKGIGAEEPQEFYKRFLQASQFVGETISAETDDQKAETLSAIDNLLQGALMILTNKMMPQGLAQIEQRHFNALYAAEELMKKQQL